MVKSCWSFERPQNEAHIWASDGDSDEEKDKLIDCAFILTLWYEKFIQSHYSTVHTFLTGHYLSLSTFQWFPSELQIYRSDTVDKLKMATHLKIYIFGIGRRADSIFRLSSISIWWKILAQATKFESDSTCDCPT